VGTGRAGAEAFRLAATPVGPRNIHNRS
jgi:hypothetical protein